MPEQTQSNIDQTQLVHQPAPTVANPPPKSTSPKPPQQNGDRDSDSEDDEPKVARDVAIGGMGAIVGGVVVGATMMKLTVNNSGVASDDAAKELEELKQKMKDISSVLQLGDGEVNKDTLEAAISNAIKNAENADNTGGWRLKGFQDREYTAKRRLAEILKKEEQFELEQFNIETDLQNEKKLKEELKEAMKILLVW